MPESDYRTLMSSSVLDVLRRLVRHRAAEEGLDDVEGHVDAGGDAGGGDDAVVDHPGGAFDGDARAEGVQGVEGGPVGGGPAAFQKAGLAQEEGAGADGGDLPGLGRRAADPVEGLLVVEERPGA